MTALADFERDIALRHSVETLMVDYVHCIDDDRLEEWPDFFTEDGTYRVATRENRQLGLPVSLIYCAGRGMLRDRISALRVANIYEPHSYCHMISAIRLLDRSGDELRAQSNFTVIRTMADGEMSVFACGRYEDCIVETADGFRFRERIAVLESRRIDTLLVIPL